MLKDSKSAGSSSVEVTPQERRRYPRYPFSASAEAVELATRTRLNARISDLARGGCYADTINPFPLGTDLSISITKDNESFVAQAKVLYVAVGLGMGLVFTAIEPEQLLVLEKWIAGLSGEAAPEQVQGQNGESSNNEQRYVLSELIIALIRKRVLSDAEGQALLQKLLN